MLGALLAPIGMPTVSVLADSFYQNQTSAHALILQTGLPAHLNKLKII